MPCFIYSTKYSLIKNEMWTYPYDEQETFYKATIRVNKNLLSLHLNAYKSISRRKISICTIGQTMQMPQIHTINQFLLFWILTYKGCIDFLSTFCSYNEKGLRVYSYNTPP